MYNYITAEDLNTGIVGATLSYTIPHLIYAGESEIESEGDNVYVGMDVGIAMDYVKATVKFALKPDKWDERVQRMKNGK